MSQLDAQGEAHDALGSAVARYGQRILGDPRTLSNYVADMLPDQPRERSLLVTGAEAGIAAEMTQRVETQHIDADTAVQLTARSLSENRSIDPAASLWVAHEYARALGYQVRPYAPPAGGPVSQPFAERTATWLPPGNQAGGGFAAPAGGGFAPPAGGGFAPPAGGGFAAPAGNFAPPPDQSSQPTIGTNYRPPMGSNSQPPAGGGFPNSQPPAGGGFPGPGAGGFPPGPGANSQPPAGGGFPGPAGGGFPGPGAGGSQPPSGGNFQGQSAGGYQPPMGGTSAPAGGYQPPMGSSQPPMGGSSSQPPGGGYPAPGGIGYQPPAAGGYQGQGAGGYQPPAAGGYQPAGGGYQPPAGGGYQAPAGNAFQAPGAGGYQNPGGGGYQPPAGGGYQAPGGAGGYQAPGGGGFQPPGGGFQPYRTPSSNSKRTGIIAGSAVAGVVVLYLIVAAIAGIAPFSKSSPPKAAPAPSHKASAPASPTVTATPTPSLAAGITPLQQLLPQDISDPSTQCHTDKPQWKMPGLVSALSCTDPDLSKGAVLGFQVDSKADYNTAWKNFNTWWGFSSGNAKEDCPPTGDAEGLEKWWSGAYPKTQGQVLECWIVKGNAPVYVWTLPSQDMFYYVSGGDNTTFKALDAWWRSSDSNPAGGPSAKPSSTSS